jgi:hypothetical protein
MLTFVCDYALISPAVLATRIECEVLVAVADWQDVDEDRFVFRVMVLFDGEDFTPSEVELINSLVAPYLYKE